MNKLIRNANTLLTNPEIARDYLYYWGSKLRNSGKAVRTFSGGIKITDFTSFSEFHSIGSFISNEEREFLLKYPIESGAIIDVGANLGIVSLTLAKRFAHRTIHSFEPVSSTFRAFKANIELNSCANIQASQCAVSDHEGEVSFNADPIGRATNSIATSSGDYVVTVPCTTLDAYAETNSIDNIAFLKVDVEGFEATVFQGAGRILGERRAAMVYYEVCPGNCKIVGTDPEMPTRILQQNGYEIFKVDEGGSLRPADVSEINRVVLDNWVALRP